MEQTPAKKINESPGPTKEDHPGESSFLTSSIIKLIEEKSEEGLIKYEEQLREIGREVGKKKFHAHIITTTGENLVLDPDLARQRTLDAASAIQSLMRGLRKKVEDGSIEDAELVQKIVEAVTILDPVVEGILEVVKPDSLTDSQQLSTVKTGNLKF